MMPDEILVVFSDQTDLPWLRFLRRGFRHCFLILRFGDVWVSVDALANRTEILRLDMPDIHHMVSWLESGGDRVLRIAPPAPERITQKVLVPCPYTCVEQVKRIAGIRQAFIFTPWQLYRFLLSRKEKPSWDV